MIPRSELQRLAHRLKMNELVLEKDYVLTWALLGIADSDLTYIRSLPLKVELR